MDLILIRHTLNPALHLDDSTEMQQYTENTHGLSPPKQHNFAHCKAEDWISEPCCQNFENPNNMNSYYIEANHMGVQAEGSLSHTDHDMISAMINAFGSQEEIPASNKKAKQYICTICGKILSTHSSLRTHHLYKHSEAGKGKERNFHCDLCSKTFKFEFDLKRHKRIFHAPEPPKPKKQQEHICTICGKILANNPSLIRHFLYKHSETAKGKERNFHCDLCSKTFRFEFDLKNHKRRSHPHAHARDRDREPFLINAFGSKEKIQASKVAGARSKLNKKKKQHICTICGKSLSNQTNLRTHHLYKHSEAAKGEERNFHCDLCSKTFKFESNLKGHKATSHAPGPFLCGTCQKGFKLRTSRDYHEQAYNHATKKWICSFCGKLLCHESALRMHCKFKHGELAMEQVINQTDYPDKFICGICGKRFKAKSTLINHHFTHSSTREFKCSVPSCKSKFYTPDALKSHTRRQHRTPLVLFEKDFVVANVIEVP